MVSIRLVGVRKRFGEFEALKGVTLDIRDGEFFFVLGPSGCGKTTLLRIIAGLYTPDEGDIYFGNRRVNDVPPYDRNIGMVFQNYALWPHMNVFDNVAYGLKARRLPRHGIEKKVRRALRLVGLEGMENKYPSQLSGGQQQRVALARALVVEPDVLLLDEPLSNLDAKLRARMRRELKALQKDLGVTTVYVTHDQAEALSMADRIAVMSFGVVEQVGTPKEIYAWPKTRFVADFIGEINLLEAMVSNVVDRLAVLETALGPLRARVDKIVSGSRVVIGFRPENARVSRKRGFKLRVRDVLFYGFYEEAVLEADGVVIRVFLRSEERWFKPGDEVFLDVEPDDVIVLGAGENGGL